MAQVPVFYATSEGHTRRIAEEIASTLRSGGFDSEPIELTADMPTPDWINIAGAVVGASLHVGRHQRAAETFITRQAQHLNVRPTALFSVSLSIASKNPTEADAARAIAASFARTAGWQPIRIACIAGRLAYTQYNFLTRWMMRRIARKEGGPTDTSRDHVLTDWTMVRAFARDVADDVRERLAHPKAS
jgi:menaquinone-dependent protoporphyrinogen oxidase